MLQFPRCEKFLDPREVRESAFLARDVSIESFLFGSHLTDRLIASFAVPSPFNADGGIKWVGANEFELGKKGNGVSWNTNSPE